MSKYSTFPLTATCVAVCVCAHAQATAPAATLPVASDALWTLLQVLFALAVVIAGIFVCAALMRRLSPGMVGGAAKLKVAGAVMVGPKERVVVVELNDTWLVLGVSGVEINLLHSLPRPEGLSDTVSPQPSPFAEKLASLLARREHKA